MPIPKEHCMTACIHDIHIHTIRTRFCSWFTGWGKKPSYPLLARLPLLSSTVDHGRIRQLLEPNARNHYTSSHARKEKKREDTIVDIPFSC